MEGLRDIIYLNGIFYYCYCKSNGSRISLFYSLLTIVVGARITVPVYFLFNSFLTTDLN